MTSPDAFAVQIDAARTTVSILRAKIDDLELQLQQLQAAVGQRAADQSEAVLAAASKWPPEAFDLNERDAAGQKVWLTATEVAGLAKVTETTARKWAGSFDIAIRIGGRLHFHRDRTMTLPGR